MKGQLCIVCGKPCQPPDKNSDGTYAHRECLAAHQTQPTR